MKLKPYPGTTRTRTGCKVGWRTYDTLAQAEECAAAARHNAQQLAANGYDFGYQAPGSITPTDDGCFEVCIP